MELAQRHVVLREFALALEHVDFHRRLVVRRGREGLGAAGGDGGVALDHRRGHAAEGFDAEGQWGHVEQQHVGNALVSGNDAGLEGSTKGDGFVRVDALVGRLAGLLLDGFLDGWDARRATHEDDLVDVTGLEAGVLDGLTGRGHRLLNESRGQLLEGASREADVKVLRVAVAHGDERQTNLRLLGSGKLDFGLLRGFLEAGHGLRVAGQVNAGALLEFGQQPFNHGLVEVVAAEHVVAGRRLDFDLGLAVDVVNLQHGDVEGTATEVVHQDGLVDVLVHAVGQGGSGGLVDDAEHFEAGNAPGVPGGLALCVGEVGRAGDDGLGDVVTEVGFCVRFELLQNEGADLLRRVGRFVHVRGPVRAHVALDGDHGAVWVGDRLALRGHADQALATVLRKRDHRGRGACTFGVRDDHGFTVFDGRDAAVCGSKIDANDVAHVCSSKCVQRMGMPPSSSSSSSSSAKSMAMLPSSTTGCSSS